MTIGLLIYFMRQRTIWALLSFPVLFTLFVGQVDLLFALVILWIGPLAIPLLLAKPQVGFVVAPWLIRAFGWRGLWKAAIGGVLTLAVCFIIRPTWIFDWLSNTPSLAHYSVRDSSLFFILTAPQKIVLPFLAGLALIVALFIPRRRRWALTSLFQPLSNIYSVSMLAVRFGPLQFGLSWIAFALTGGDIYSGAPMFLVALSLLFMRTPKLRVKRVFENRLGGSRIRG